MSSPPGTPEAALRAPDPSGLWGELRGVLELPRLLLRFPRLSRQPRGRGERILVLPGYGAGDASTSVLRAYLASHLGLGFSPEVFQIIAQRLAQQETPR
jgi:hypothetical protein